jgi:hypothetical protein
MFIMEESIKKFAILKNITSHTESQMEWNLLLKQEENPYKDIEKVLGIVAFSKRGPMILQRDEI